MLQMPPEMRRLDTVDSQLEAVRQEIRNVKDELVEIKQDLAAAKKAKNAEQKQSLLDLLVSLNNRLNGLEEAKNILLRIQAPSKHCLELVHTGMLVLSRGRVCCKLSRGGLYYATALVRSCKLVLQSMHPHFGHVDAFDCVAMQALLWLRSGFASGFDVPNNIVSSLQALAGDMAILMTYSCIISSMVLVFMMPAEISLLSCSQNGSSAQHHFKGCHISGGICPIFSIDTWLKAQHHTG